MEIIAAARILRALCIRTSRRQQKRSRFGFSLGMVLALIALSPLAMTDAQATTAVGTIAGSAGVSATGAATYTIPITLPPGTHGMQPSLALTYDSQSADGLAGFGWTLSGMSSITRCPQNKEDDGETLPVQFIASDDYCLDGQKLIVISGTAGGNGTTYGTQMERFSIITSYTGAPINNGPSWFTVQTKDGRTYEYGNTADSKVIAGGFSTRVRVWALDKVTDAIGNYMTYTYGSNSAGTEYFPKKIAYTGNGGTTPDHTVAFAYNLRSPGTLKASYQSGALIVLDNLLSTITVTTGTVSYGYTLGYGADPVNGRPQLQSVQECGTDGSCYPATTIAWRNVQAGWGPDVNTGVALVGYNNALDAHLIDVDGDGIKDLVFTNDSSGTWWVMFGQPGGGFSTVRDTGDATNGVTADAIALDYNGDGRMDLAIPYPGTNSWVVLQATGGRTAGAGYIFNAVSNNIPALTAINSATDEPIYAGNVWPGSFTGDGAASDIIYSDGTHLNVLNNGGPAGGDVFAAAQTVLTGSGLSGTGSSTNLDVGVDFDGSTRAGGLIVDFENPNTVWLALTQNSNDNALVSMGSISTNPAFKSNGQSFPAISLDANGDGSTDVLSSDSSSGGVLQLSLSTGSSRNGFITMTEGLEQSSEGSDPVVADYYADGRKEAIVEVTGGVWDILDTYFSTAGNFVVTQTGYGSAPYLNAPYAAGYIKGSLRVGNISASGLDDLVYAVSTGPTTFDWHYRLHNGGAADLVTSITDGLGNVSSFQYASLADGSVYTKGNSAVYPVQDIQPTMQVVSQYTMTPATATSYHFNYTYSTAQTDTNGHGFLGFGSRTITDSRNGNVETKFYSLTWPWVGTVTSDVLAKSTGDLIRDTENTFGDDLAIGGSLPGRHFPFFDYSQTTDYDFVSGIVQPIRVITTTIHRSSFDGYGNLLTSTTTIGQPGTPLPPPSFTTTTTTQYAAPGSVYCADLPTQITVQRQAPTVSGISFPDPASRVTTISENTTTCQPSSVTAASGQSGDGSIPVTTTYASHDAYGNITEVDVGSGATMRTTKYSFAGGNGELPTSITNVVSGSLNLISQTTWNYALGLEATSTDPNGNLTRMSYDGFGRLVSVERPDGSGSASSYKSCPGSITCPTGTAYYLLTTASGMGSTSIYTGLAFYDSLGKATTQETMPFGDVISRIDTAYDAMGNVTSITKPYLVTSPSATTQIFSTSYVYDLAMNRLISIATPQDQTDTCSPTCNNNTTFSFNDLMATVRHTVSNSASSSGTQLTSKTVDLIGEIVSTEDTNGGMTTYSYDAFGDLIATHDANNKLTTMNYDGLGHKTGMVDPNMGTWSYQVDALGEVICQTDAKMQSIVMAYDNVGRLTTKKETSPQSGADCTPASGDIVYTGNWTYDSVTNGKGLPASLNDSNGFSRSYVYDTHSRPTGVTTTVPNIPVGSGSTSYTTSTAYDTFGRLATITYPATAVTGLAPFAVNYNYDSTSGALASVSDAATSFVYWQVATGGSAAPVDAFGHILAYEDGNTVSTVTAYDQATGAVLGIGTGLSGSTSIQQLAYSWDGFGNLISRCDANKGLTETFTYDGLDRISTSAVNTGATACSGGTTGPAMSLTYDAIGNIQTRTNTGITFGSGTLNDTYTYGNSSHPDAVMGVTSMPGTYAYDADGNMTQGNNRTITWNDDNLPTSISSTGTVNGNNAVTGSSTFSYSPDLQRYSQVTTDSIADNSNTTYVGGLFEVVSAGSSTQYRHNIVADGVVVDVHTIDQTGTATNAYIHTDHLGSSDTITDDTGTVVQQSSFDAFGLRRDPTSWAYDLTGTQIASLKSKTDRGYTFQEQLDSVGLVHMNGRVYDPSIGRFISADPKLPNPLYSQAYDRYAYVYNNPLAMKDPSGYDGCDAGMTCIQTDPPAADPLPIVAPVQLIIPLPIIGPPPIMLPPPQKGLFTGSHIPGVDTGCKACDMSLVRHGNDDPTVNSGSSGEGGSSSSGNGSQQNVSLWVYVAMAGTEIVGLGPENPAADAAAAAEYEAATATEAAESETAGETAIATDETGTAADVPASTPVGRSGNPMDVEPGTNSPGSVNGTDYTGHAFDQMQSRGIPPSAVQNTIETGIPSPGNVPGTTVYYDSANGISVVTNSAGKVITTYPGGG
ncbi:MAG TPA: SpvB/TcaC N-terminal domain-containing protein [Gammaproteobacteria bacterium]|jgi:RHS repeat-associated protein